MIDKYGKGSERTYLGRDEPGAALGSPVLAKAVTYAFTFAASAGLYSCARCVFSQYGCALCNR